MTETTFNDVFMNDVKMLKRDNLHLKLRVQELESDMETIKRMLKTIVIEQKQTSEVLIEEGEPELMLYRSALIVQRFFKSILYKKRQRSFYTKYDFFKEWKTFTTVRLRQKMYKKNLADIQKSNIKNIWYMNGNPEDIKVWDTHIKNKIVLTWNHDGKNENMKKKLKKNDIIAWYIIKKGFNSVLRVIDTPKILTVNELPANHHVWKHEYKTLESLKQDVDMKYERISISVEFLATTDKHFVNQSSIRNWNHDWTTGLRGSSCMRPSNPHWREQVIEMYKYINEFNGLKQ